MNLLQSFPERLDQFIKYAHENHVKMILIGGAVNFHGYQRHSANVDFWIEVSQENLTNLLTTFHYGLPNF